MELSIGSFDPSDRTLLSNKEEGVFEPVYLLRKELVLRAVFLAFFVGTGFAWTSSSDFLFAWEGGGSQSSIPIVLFP